MFFSLDVKKQVKTKNKKIKRFYINNLTFIYFSIFILLTQRASNYPDLLPDIPRYCCLVKTFHLGHSLACPWEWDGTAHICISHGRVAMS